MMKKTRKNSNAQEPSPWELAGEMLKSGIPGIFEEENEQVWIEQSAGPELAQDEQVKILWHSRVPGSRAEESICLSAIQATENKGCLVPEGLDLYRRGCAALEQGDMPALHRITYELFQACYEAERDEKSPYWDQKFYNSFEDYTEEVSLLEGEEPAWAETSLWLSDGGNPAWAETSLSSIDMKQDCILDKYYAGWLAQIIGGAYGTCLEGYTTDAILKKFGEVKEYIRKPNTYNDDITYELALLEAYRRCQKDTDEREIAYEWLSRIPTGWSAEAWALNNLRCGMMPPASGAFHNPFNEWIGAQMRGAICGQLFPGNPYGAAKAAWMDGSISHAGNGILGEVFNALLVSLAYVESDMRELLKRCIALIPKDSEYGRTIRFAYETCSKEKDYLSAWRICEKKYERYNWIHAYPNACIEVVALYFGQGEFEKTLMICGTCGQDVDCNAAQVMAVLGTAYGSEIIPDYWSAPFGDRLDTTVRGMKCLSIRELALRTWETACKLAD